MSENYIKKREVVSWNGVIEIGHKVKEDVNSVYERDSWKSNVGYE